EPEDGEFLEHALPHGEVVNAFRSLSKGCYLPVERLESARRSSRQQTIESRKKATSSAASAQIQPFLRPGDQLRLLEQAWGEYMKSKSSGRNHPRSSAKEDGPATLERSNELLIAAIGASAGGIEAFTELVTSLPNDTGM